MRENRKHGLKGGGWRRATKSGTAPAAYQIRALPSSIDQDPRLVGVTEADGGEGSSGTGAGRPKRLIRTIMSTSPPSNTMNLHYTNPAGARN